MLRLLMVQPLLRGHDSFADDIEGAYERVSLTITRTGEAHEALSRRGLLIMAHGLNAMMTQNPDRRVLSRHEREALSDDEEITLNRQWLDINAHGGCYEAADGKLTWHRDLSEDPKEAGTTSRLSYEHRGEDRMIFLSLPHGDRRDWVWRTISN